MPRFAIAYLLAMTAAPAWSQTAGVYSDPGKANANPTEAPAYDIPEGPKLAFSNPYESRIFAGTEVLPNTMVGFGMFGPKAERAMHAPATARDLATSHSRKASVGFSLKF